MAAPIRRNWRGKKTKKKQPSNGNLSAAHESVRKDLQKIHLNCTMQHKTKKRKKSLSPKNQKKNNHPTATCLLPMNLYEKISKRSI
jgi:hypothetical protein